MAYMPGRDFAKVLMSESSNFKPKVARIIIKIDMSPVCENDTPLNEDVFYTDGNFYISYVPDAIRNGIVFKRHRRPYLIYADIFAKCEKNWSARVRDYDEFLKFAETNKYYSFIKKYTTICKELFDIAKSNQYFKVTFTFDWKMVVEKSGLNLTPPSLQLNKNIVEGNK